MSQLTKCIPFFLLVSFLAAQQPPTVEEPPREGVVSGMVVDVTTQEPLPKVTVQIRSARPPSVDSFSARTDDEGKFSIENVTPGRYSLSLYKNAFVYAETGVAGSLQRGGVLDVGPGQVIDELVLGLQPAAVVAGRVVDQDGEPLEGLGIEAAQFRYLNGSRELTAMGRSSTDDKGEYRIYGLAPGDYYMRVNMDSMRSMNTRRLLLGDDSGYIDTYYPNANDAAQASLIRVSAAAETTGIDFRMTPTTTLGISGVIADAEGRPGLGGSITVLDRSKKGRQYNARRIPSRPDGKFEAIGLPPGSYRFEAMLMSRDRSRNFVVYDFDLTDHSLEDLNLRAQPSFSAEGRMVIEGDYDDSAAPLPAQVVMEPDGPYNMRISYAVSRDGGRLVFEGLTPGSYRIRGGNGRGELYLKSARYDGRDATKEPVFVEPDGGEFEIVLSANGARVDGQVSQDAEGVSGVRVVLMPDDRSRTDLFRTVATDQYGVFGLTGIAPGRYKLFAWERIENSAWLDPNVVAEVEEQGVRVEVEEGDAKRVTPKLIEAED